MHSRAAWGLERVRRPNSSVSAPAAVPLAVNWTGRIGGSPGPFGVGPASYCLERAAVLPGFEAELSAGPRKSRGFSQRR